MDKKETKNENAQISKKMDKKKQKDEEDIEK
jgi:hypothetical protein